MYNNILSFIFNFIMSGICRRMRREFNLCCISLVIITIAKNKYAITRKILSHSYSIICARAIFLDIGFPRLFFNHQSMAARLRALSNDRDLRRFVVQAETTGKNLGTGSYGTVEEVMFSY